MLNRFSAKFRWRAYYEAKLCSGQSPPLSITVQAETYRELMIKLACVRELRPARRAHTPSPTPSPRQAPSPFPRWIRLICAASNTCCLVKFTSRPGPVLQRRLEVCDGRTLGIGDEVREMAVGIVGLVHVHFPFCRYVSIAALRSPPFFQRAEKYLVAAPRTNLNTFIHFSDLALVISTEND